jgi:hypothetical protein
MAYYRTEMPPNKRKKLLVAGRNSIVEKQLQNIFDCLNEPEAFAKIEAQYLKI